LDQVVKFLLLLYSSYFSHRLCLWCAATTEDASRFSKISLKMYTIIFYFRPFSTVYILWTGKLACIASSELFMLMFLILRIAGLWITNLVQAPWNS